MPYIDPEDRRRAVGLPCSAGELNFAITALVVDYIARDGLGYQSYNDALGALEGAKLELYRRRVSPYEDRKCALNGDVY